MQQVQTEEHPLAAMRNAGTALEILSFGDSELAKKVRLRVCCKYHGTQMCVRPKKCMKGRCGRYRLDETKSIEEIFQSISYLNS